MSDLHEKPDERNVQPAIATDRIVVYTALFGSYEALVEQPMAADSAVKFVCFTDDETLESDSWEVRLLRPTVPWDSTRMARKSKILGYREFEEAEATLWIDNRVILREPPEVVVNSLLAEADIAMPLHDHRSSVADEFTAVLRAGFDEPHRVREQLHFISAVMPVVLHEVPLWTAIVARRRTPEVDRAMDTWWDLVMRHSRRDQLSANYAVRDADVRINKFSLPNVESHMHTWLRIEALPKRKDVLFSRGWKYTLAMHLRDALSVNRYSIAIRTRVRKLASRVRHVVTRPRGGR